GAHPCARREASGAGRRVDRDAGRAARAGEDRPRTGYGQACRRAAGREPLPDGAAAGPRRVPSGAGGTGPYGGGDGAPRGGSATDGRELGDLPATGGAAAGRGDGATGREAPREGGGWRWKLSGRGCCGATRGGTRKHADGR